jgi:methionyl-tRNA synthetase
VLDPIELIDVYGVDPVRFWVARIVPFGQDGDVTLDSFRERYERELANDLGNLLSRTTAMISRYRDGDVPAAPDESSELAAVARALGDDVAKAFDAWDVTGALDSIWAYVRRLNKHVEETKPWELAKDDARAAELDRALYELADGLRIVAVALASFLPDTSERILEALGQANDVAWENVAYGRTELLSGIEASQPLFPRIEPLAPA